MHAGDQSCMQASVAPHSQSMGALMRVLYYPFSLLMKKQIKEKELYAHKIGLSTSYILIGSAAVAQTHSCKLLYKSHSCDFFILTLFNNFF